MKREIHTNYRLVIDPALPGSYLRASHTVHRTVLDDMAAQVRRHVDHVGTVTVEWDTRSECSYCGREWEVLTAEDLAASPESYPGCTVGEPMCCGQAATEFRAEQASKGGA